MARTIRWASWGLVVALACGGEQRGAAVPGDPAAAAAAEAPAAAPSGPVVARTIGPDGEVFEAEFGKADQLPSDFPDDVPLYGNARPMSSLASREHGTVVNLRSSDPPAQVFAWYRDHYAQQGWEIEHASEAHARSTVVARKGNRVSSVVIQGVPGMTQALLTVTEDR
jgi:hypothetical protein